jgi:PAS domain S-box-containing protein
VVTEEVFGLTYRMAIIENGRGIQTCARRSCFVDALITFTQSSMYTQPGHTGVTASPMLALSANEVRLMATIKELEAKQRHMVCLMESARDAVLEMDTEGLITAWNGSAEQMLGWTAAEAIGQNMCSLIVPHQYRPAHEAGFALYLRTGQARTINRLLEIEALHKNGSQVAIELSIFTVATDGTVSFGAFIRDISSRRAAETALRLSEERYRAVIEHVNDGVVVIQHDQVVFANQRAATILATSRPDLRQRGFLHRLHPDDQALVRARQQSQPMMDHEVPGRIDVRVPGPGGTVRWLSIGVTTIPWDGQTASLSFFSDITESRSLVESVRRSTERYRAVIEHADEGMIVIQDQRVAFANARAADIAGMQLDEMRRAGYLDRIHPDDRPMVDERQRKRLAGEPVPSRYELRLLMPDGVIRWIGISVTVVPWDGQPAILTFFSDISRRKQLEEKLRDTLGERETILENSLVGIAFLTYEGEFRWSNQAMARMFGVSSRTGIPQNWSALFLSKEEYLRVEKDVADCMDQDRAYQSDLQMRRLDGSLFWVTVSGKAVSARDKAQGSVWTVMDITARKELETALARTSSEREAIFNSALVGIAYNVNRKMQWVNDKYEEITGYSRKDLVGHSTRMLYADDESFERDGRETREILIRDSVYVQERRFMRPNGEELWVQLAGRCVNAHNPAAGVIWTLLDITERKRAEDNIRAALEREKELNDLRSRFVAMTSHEFRTPLAAILSAAELLRDYSDRMPSSEKGEVLEKINGGAQRMARMLDRVLLIGQVEAQMLEFNPRPIDLPSICQAIVEETCALQPETNCKVLTHFTPAPPGAVFDAKLLRHIFGNLVSNAIKYSPRGGVVAFRVFSRDGKTVFEVEDQGLGIPPDEMVHLFEPFHRASNVADIQGTGLGLAIVKKSVELHGGTIEVSSEQGVRTCFSVTL